MKLLCAHNKFDDIATASAFAKAPIAIECGCHNEASIRSMIADRARAAKLRANSFQVDAEQLAGTLDRNSLAQFFKVNTLWCSHWRNLS